MKIALAQLNPTIGDIGGNTRQIVDAIDRARSAGADLVVFGELSITGYPPKDLLLKDSLIDENLAAMEQIARAAQGIDALVGYVDRNRQSVGRPLHNAVALLRDGAIVSRHFKTLLPTYDVFDESRYFEPGPISERNNIVTIAGRKVGLSICEDLWNDERLILRRLYHQNPIEDLVAAGAEIVINISASPYVVDKHAFRLDLLGGQAAHVRRPIVYVNQVGGNDELIFDGNSCVLNTEGKVIAQAGDFQEDLLIADLNGSSRIEQPAAGIESMHKALVLGLGDYVRKCGFRSVVLGLSGGIDSALTAAIAVEALGKQNVTGVAMPSQYSSDHSIADAKSLAENLGIEFHIIPIRPMYDAFEAALQPAFAGRPADLTEENLQARARGVLLMAFSNKFNHLLLTTGNKSELAVGYCTLYGDMCGGLAVISDVPKTTVYQMSEFINQAHGREIIPRNTITKPPSAELRPNQTDQDSLPPYDVLDAILMAYVEEEKSVEDIIARGHDPQTVLRVVQLIDRSEYKRRQAAPGLKVTSRAFGFGRRMPMAQRYRQVVS